jgi:Protein of unknown function (DUF1569)
MANKSDRRTLHFDSLEQAIAEAESLTRATVTTTGKYSLGQILEHLARTIEIALGQRSAPTIPFPIRMAARMMRPRLLNKPMRSGFKLPSKSQSVFWPDHDVEAEAGLQHYRDAIALFHRTDPHPTHPLLGDITRAEHTQLQCRHAELHLSFVRPA